MRKLLSIALIAAIMNSGCANLFMSRNQKIIINASNPTSKIYVNDELEGTGSASFKTKKEGVKQIVLQTKGYKDNYHVLLANKRQPGYWVCIAGDALFVPAIYGYMGLIWDAYSDKTHAYSKITSFDVTGKIPVKTKDYKYIYISNIGVDLRKQKGKDKDKEDVTYYRIHRDEKKDLQEQISEAEKKKQVKDDKEEDKKLKKKEKEHLKDSEAAKKYDDTKFSYNIYKTLKYSGFVDTVNKVFQDQNNTLVLEGKITKINVYNISTKKKDFLYSNYHKSKVFLTWYFKNQFGEVLDSINTKELSGDFVLYNYLWKSSRTDDHQQKQIEKMIGDAIDNSYLNLFNNKNFKTYIQSEPIKEITEATIHLNKPTDVVTEKSDAALASVIIKRDDEGHGSGFAISQDGYILTNYHVIASTNPKKTEKIKVLTSTGEELTPTVVRVNKARDIALLKVDKTFEKAFVLSPDKQFKPLEDVYTIGAPKSIELGQTVTTGIISNERNANNNELLQLSMPVNGGNSGGPLFNKTGILDGVIVAKLVGENTEGISFAIPAYKIGEYLKISYNQGVKSDDRIAETPKAETPKTETPKTERPKTERQNLKQKTKTKSRN